MQITVLQWNVWFREDIDNVVQVLRNIDADIVCLQELTQGYIEQTKENTWEHIQNELNYQCVHQTIPVRTESAQWSQANAIFSRYDLSNRTSNWLHVPENDDDLFDQYRGYLAAEVDLGNTMLSVGTTHMSFQVYPGDEDPELAQLLSVIEKKNKNFIMTGDLNATPDSHRVKTLDRRLKPAGPPYDENTWTTKPHKTDKFEASTLEWRYDYVYATQDVKVIDAKIIQTNVSDHLPILVTIEIA